MVFFNSSATSSDYTKMVNLTTIASLNITSRNNNNFTDRTYVMPLSIYLSYSITSASICICLLVLIFSFRKNKQKYFKWKMSQRFVVVSSFCDIMFYGVQMVCITNVGITRTVPSHDLCTVYAFFLLFFAYAQCRLSIVVATTACIRIMKQKHLKLGIYDWKLFVFMSLDGSIILSVVAFYEGMDFNGI